MPGPEKGADVRRVSLDDNLARSPEPKGKLGTMTRPALADTAVAAARSVNGPRRGHSQHLDPTWTSRLKVTSVLHELRPDAPNRPRFLKRPLTVFRIETVRQLREMPPVSVRVTAASLVTLTRDERACRWVERRRFPLGPEYYAVRGLTVLAVSRARRISPKRRMSAFSLERRDSGRPSRSQRLRRPQLPHAGLHREGIGSEPRLTERERRPSLGLLGRRAGGRSVPRAWRPGLPRRLPYWWQGRQPATSRGWDLCRWPHHGRSRSGRADSRSSRGSQGGQRRDEPFPRRPCTSPLAPSCSAGRAARQSATHDLCPDIGGDQFVGVERRGGRDDGAPGPPEGRCGGGGRDGTSRSGRSQVVTDSHHARHGDRAAHRQVPAVLAVDAPQHLPVDVDVARLSAGHHHASRDRCGDGKRGAPDPDRMTNQCVFTLYRR